MIESLVNHKPVQISCGNNHSVALLSTFYNFDQSKFIGNGEAYSWGANENG